MDGRQVPPERIDSVLGPLELVLEATGARWLPFDLLDALTFNGVHILTGNPGGHSVVRLPASDLIREMVLSTQEPG